MLNIHKLLKRNNNELVDYFNRKVKSTILSLLRYFILICVSFVVLYPFLHIISSAIKTGEEMLDPSVIWIPKQVTLKTLQIAYKSMNYPVTLMNSAIFAFSGSLISMVICSITGYGFARFKFKGKSLVFGILIFSIIVPVQTVMIPLFVQIKYFDLFGIGKIIQLFTGNKFTIDFYNTPFSYIMPTLFGSGIKSAFFIYIFRQFFKGLPGDLEDAAYIDGCGYFKTFLKVIAPSAQSAYLVVFILSLIWHWNDFQWIPMYYPYFRTLPSALESIVSTSGIRNAEFYDIYVWQRAGGLLLVAPMLIFFGIMQKYFMQSIDRTGLK